MAAMQACLRERELPTSLSKAVGTMFREIRFYDDYTDAVTAPWWLFCLLGLNFILLGVLIVIFPELLAYLAEAFLLFNGLVLLLVGWKFRRFKKLYRGWRETLWQP